MLSHKYVFRLSLACAVFATLSTTALASQTIHYTEDFTDNNASDDSGIAVDTPAYGGQDLPILKTQSSWRNASQSYLGPATPFDGTNASYLVSFGSPATLASGNVWVLDMSMISDVAMSAQNHPLDGTPGIIVEDASGAPFNGPIVRTSFTTADGGLPNSQQLSGDVKSTLGPDFAPDSISPLPTALSGAGLPTALNSTVRVKWAYQPTPGGSPTTRISTQSLGPSHTNASAAFTDSATFRTSIPELRVQIDNPNLAGAGTGNSFGVTYSTGAGGAQNVSPASPPANLELGITSITFKQVRSTDFNTDGIVNVSGDGSRLVANLGLSGKSFFEGDATGDGLVNVSGDGSRFVSQLGTDVLASGQGLAEYDPATGQVLISTNGAGFIEVNSLSLAQLIPANAVPTNTAGLGASFSDPFTNTTVNYLSFSALGTGGILNDFSIGAILPTGISDPSGFVPGAVFRWSVVGGGEFSAGVHIIPEPSSLILAGLGGIGLGWLHRRRRQQA